MGIELRVEGARGRGKNFETPGIAPFVSHRGWPGLWAPGREKSRKSAAFYGNTQRHDWSFCYPEGFYLPFSTVAREQCNAARVRGKGGEKIRREIKRETTGARRMRRRIDGALGEDRRARGVVAMRV